MTCRAQDYIKPQRFDTISCKIVQVDDLWIYYTIKGQSRKYKKAYVEAYAYQNVWETVKHPPPVNRWTTRSKLVKHVYSESQIDSMAGSLLEEAGWIKIGSGILKIFGALQFTSSLAAFEPEKRLTSSLGGFVLITIACVMDISAANNQIKAGKWMKNKGKEQVSYQAEQQLKADSISR